MEPEVDGNGHLGKWGLVTFPPPLPVLVVLQSFLSGEYSLNVRFHQTCLFVVDSRAQRFIFKSEYMIFQIV